MLSKQAILVAPRKFAFRHTELNPGKGQLLVRVSVCGLCGWELNHWRGAKGQLPMTLGHEWAGTVTALGEGVHGFSVGDKIAYLPTGADGLVGFAEYALANAANCFKLAAETDLKYALLEPLKCIVTALDATAACAGEYGVVIGCGPMGQWCLQVLAKAGLAGLAVVDIDDRRLEMAKQWGDVRTINPLREDMAAVVAEMSKEHMADFVIEGTGVASAADQAIACLRTGRGRLVFTSTLSQPYGGIDLAKALSKGAVFRFAMNAYSADGFNDMRRAVALLENGTFTVKALITHEFTLDTIQQAFEALEHRDQTDFVKGIVLCG